MHEASFGLSEFITWLSMSVVRWIISECWCMIWDSTVIFVESSVCERKRQTWIFKSLKLFVNCIHFLQVQTFPSSQFSFQWIGNVVLDFFTVRCLSCCVCVLLGFFLSWPAWHCDLGIREKGGREAPVESHKEERFYSNFMQVRLQNMKILLESI